MPDRNPTSLVHQAQSSDAEAPSDPIPVNKFGGRAIIVWMDAFNNDEQPTMIIEIVNSLDLVSFKERISAHFNLTLHFLRVDSLVWNDQDLTIQSNFDSFKASAVNTEKTVSVWLEAEELLNLDDDAVEAGKSVTDDGGLDFAYNHRLTQVADSPH